MNFLENKIKYYAELMPQKVALINASNQITYEKLWTKSLEYAYQLRNTYGIHKGDCVIISATANIEFVYTYLGVHISGGICIPIDPETNQTRYNLIKSETLPKIILGTLNNVSDQNVVSFGDIKTTSYQLSYECPDENDISDVIFTTGTTGLPKGIALSYYNIATAVGQINSFIKNSQQDVELLALPISHSFGLGRLRCVLSLGGTLVLLGSFANVKRFYRFIDEYKVTGFGMVPASWGFLKKMSGKYIQKYATQLKYIEIGSSFMSLEDKRLLMELLPYTRLCMHYGLTEASRSAYIEFNSESTKLDSIGKEVENVEIAIFDSQGNKLPYKEIGEVCIKGKHIFSKYWNQSILRYKQDFFDGYFRTGDCGYIDNDGYIYLISRIKEMINVGGKKVSPIEVESFLNELEGIKESACIGIKDPNGIMGEVVKAYIVPFNEELNDNEIISHLKSRIESYKIPVCIERIKEIPKTSSGKIQRLKLKE